MSVAKNVVWNGSSWVESIPYVWNGSAWAEAHSVVWNGSAWVQIPNWKPSGRYPPVALTSNMGPPPYQCAYSSQYNTSTYAGYRAFNLVNSDDYAWLSSSSDVAPWIGLYLGGASLKSIYITLANRPTGSVNGVIAASIQGSLDAANWYTIGSISGRDGSTPGYQSIHYCTNDDDTYTWVRILISNWLNKNGGGNQYVAIGEMNIYGLVST